MTNFDSKIVDALESILNAVSEANLQYEFDEYGTLSIWTHSTYDFDLLDIFHGEKKENSDA